MTHPTTFSPTNAQLDELRVIVSDPSHPNLTTLAEQFGCTKNALAGALWRNGGRRTQRMPFVFSLSWWWREWLADLTAWNSDNFLRVTFIRRPQRDWQQKESCHVES